MALSRVVSEIFNVEKCRYLEIGVRGHSDPIEIEFNGVTLTPLNDLIIESGTIR